jgi:hypothetical protein
MKYRFLAVALLLAPLCLAGAPRTAGAQSLGQFGPLNHMGTDQKSLGAYLGAGSGGMGVTGELRANYGDRATFGVQAGLVDRVFSAQVDLRGGLFGTEGEFPMMLGGEVAGGLMSGGGDTGIYGQVVPGVSFEVDAGEGQSWAGWAGLGFRLSASNHRIGRGVGLLRAGGRFNFSHQLGLVASLEDLDGTARLMVGAEMRFGGRGGSNAPGGK